MRIIFQGRSLQPRNIVRAVEGDWVLVPRTIVHVQEWNVRLPLLPELLPLLGRSDGCCPNYIIIFRAFPIHESRPPYIRMLAAVH